MLYLSGLKVLGAFTPCSFVILSAGSAGKRSKIFFIGLPFVAQWLYEYFFVSSFYVKVLEALNFSIMASGFEDANYLPPSYP